MELPRPSGLITLLSDSSTQEPYLGITKGLIKRQHPLAEILDYCHGVADVAAASWFTSLAIGRFPPGTIHLVSVAPAKANRWLAACRGDAFWLAPDNAVLATVLDQAVAGSAVEVEVRELATKQLGISGYPGGSRSEWVGVVAGMLSSQRLGFRSVGPRVEHAVPRHADRQPRVVWIDQDGNLVLNITAKQASTASAVEIRGRRLLIQSVAAGTPGELVAVVNALDCLEVISSQGSAAQVLAVERGEPILLIPKTGTLAQ